VTSNHLDATLFALSDPTRRAILARLSMGDATVGELAEPHEMSLAAVSKHLKVLEGAGLISRGREAQWRPCRLEAAPLREVSDWLEDYRRFWAASLDKLDAYLKTMHKKRGRRIPTKG
jgi:DNA-binding transcriptional ArsR family regulator